MARTTTATPKRGTATETKARNMDNKSEGMRLLYDAGYRVDEVTDIMSVPYGFAYGVAKRHGNAHLTAANRRNPPKAEATKVTRAARTQARERKASAPARASASRQAPAKATKAGRPSTARRQANRKASAKA